MGEFGEFVLGGIAIIAILVVFALSMRKGGATPSIFSRRFSAPAEFLEAMAESCDPVLADWAKRVRDRYNEITTGNFVERWEKAFMDTRPLETTWGGYYVHWSLTLQYECGKSVVRLKISPPYAAYRFRFWFSIEGVLVRVSVQPGTLSGEKYFPQIRDIHKIFGGWKKLSK